MSSPFETELELCFNYYKIVKVLGCSLEEAWLSLLLHFLVFLGRPQREELFKYSIKNSPVQITCSAHPSNHPSKTINKRHLASSSSLEPSAYTELPMQQSPVMTTSKCCEQFKHCCHSTPLRLGTYFCKIIDIFTTLATTLPVVSSKKSLIQLIVPQRKINTTESRGIKLAG